MGSTRRKLLGIIPAAVVVSLAEQFPALAVELCGGKCYEECNVSNPNKPFFRCGGAGHGKCCSKEVGGECRRATRIACAA